MPLDFEALLAHDGLRQFVAQHIEACVRGVEQGRRAIRLRVSGLIVFAEQIARGGAQGVEDAVDPFNDKTCCVLRGA
jgi:hypothetical protein